MEKAVNYLIKIGKLDTNKISDGYHTFKELYDHRIALFIALCNIGYRFEDMEGGGFYAWKSKRHSDNSVWEGWFIAGIHLDKGEQITYHLPIDVWDKLKVPELERAPEWDGHKPSDVINRLYKII